MCQSLKKEQKLYSNSPYVQIIWKTGKKPTVSTELYKGFRIILTALYHKQGLYLFSMMHIIS